MSLEKARSGFPLRKSPLKRSKNSGKLGSPSALSLKKKAKTPEQIEAMENQRILDDAFYEMIWEERDHVCESCGKRIYGELSRMYMDHLLPKSMYNHLRYERDNIALVCMDCHARKENGFPTDKHQELIDKSVELFG